MLNSESNLLLGVFRPQSDTSTRTFCDTIAMQLIHLYLPVDSDFTVEKEAM